jgi:plasmid maintenance system killer protein
LKYGTGRRGDGKTLNVNNIQSPAKNRYQMLEGSNQIKSSMKCNQQPIIIINHNSGIEIVREVKYTNLSGESGGVW